MRSAGCDCRKSSSGGGVSMTERVQLRSQQHSKRIPGIRETRGSIPDKRALSGVPCNQRAFRSSCCDPANVHYSTFLALHCEKAPL